ncbi:hypothetical protein BG000_011908 [Podila horticola]|nr:hypothetical protein BG000_011908 [Podila horticola]
MIMFTPAISSLSRIGFAYVQNVLKRSKLECLDIICCAFDLDLSDVVAHVLASIQWPTLKSLVLSGNILDQWICIWPSSGIDLHLLRLDVRGTGSALQKLSHPAALFVHRLVYSSPLVDLHLENIQLYERYDWWPIAERVDSLTLRTFVLCKRANSQLRSTLDAPILNNLNITIIGEDLDRAKVETAISRSPI